MSCWPEIAELKPDDPRYLTLKVETLRLVDDYRNNVWTAGRGPGRRPVAPRDDLIVKLARIFQSGSGSGYSAISPPCLGAVGKREQSTPKREGQAGALDGEYCSLDVIW
jgi:hypothetical protein